MKNLPLIIFIVLGVSLATCHKNNTEQEFIFEAKVLGRNSDCGLYAIKITNNIENAYEITGTNAGDIFIANNLPIDLQVDGLSISLNIRKIQDSELGFCTAMGPSYPWLYVLKAEKNNAP